MCFVLAKDSSLVSSRCVTLATGLYYVKLNCPSGTGPHLNCKHGKWWTFNFKMTVSVTGSVLQIVVLLVNRINVIYMRH